MDIIQIVLLAIVTFIFAIDQFSLTELLYRPIIACPIIGAILGDMQTGLVVGGTYELMMVGNMPVGGAQPPNAVLGGIVAMIFAVKSGLTVNEALGASVIFAVFGQYVVTLTFTLTAGLMAKADKAAEEANPSGIVAVNFIAMGILATLFTVLAIVAYVAGDAVSGTLQSFSEQASWFMGGLGVAGGMMRYVGFAILMKIMLSNDMWGFFLAGFAGAIIIGHVPTAWSFDAEAGTVAASGNLSGIALLLLAFIGFAIAFYDYQTQTAIKANAGNGNGGMEDGI